MAEILTDNWHLHLPIQTLFLLLLCFNELKAGKNVTRQFKCNKIPYCYHEQKTFSKNNFLSTS